MGLRKYRMHLKTKRCVLGGPLHPSPKQFGSLDLVSCSATGTFPQTNREPNQALVKRTFALVRPACGILLV